MDRFAFTSVAAINEQALKRQALVNELANVSTVGFKRSFETAMQSVGLDGPGFDSRFQPQAVSRDVIDLEPGPLQVTGNPLNVAMQGATVMGVVAADGSNAYARRGDMRISGDGVLELSTGQLVRGEGGPITIPAGALVRITQDGSVIATDGATGEQAVIDRLLLRDATATPLSRRSDGLFTPEGKPGTEIAQNGGLTTVTPGALEGSNVSAVAAMVHLMDQARSFEMSVRMIKESKDLDANGASMMQLQ